MRLFNDGWEFCRQKVGTGWQEMYSLVDGKGAPLLYARYLAGQKPIAMVSMDNCSHNGDKLAAAITAFAKAWEGNGKVCHFIFWGTDYD